MLEPVATEIRTTVLVIIGVIVIVSLFKKAWTKLLMSIIAGGGVIWLFNL